MTREPGELIVVNNVRWMHVPVTLVYHRHYPEVRGEGRSLREATAHLARLLARGIDCVHGPGRAAMERAVADARALRRSRAREPCPAGAVTS